MGERIGIIVLGWVLFNHQSYYKESALTASSKGHILLPLPSFYSLTLERVTRRHTGTCVLAFLSSNKGLDCIICIIKNAYKSTPVFVPAGEGS